jgi:hypothetical protein
MDIDADGARGALREIPSSIIPYWIDGCPP